MKKPKVVEEYESACCRGETPAVCWMCDHFNQRSGVCEKYRMMPPPEFAETHGACSEWIMEIPF